MLLASANYTSLKKMVSRFLEIICFASGTKEQPLEACKDCVPDSPTPTLFHHVCDAAEWLPSVYSTGDRKKERDSMFTEFGELQRQCQGQHCIEGYAERSGAMAPSVLVLSLVPQQLPPALQLWHGARACLPPEPLPAPLHQQLLPQSWESGMTAGTNVSGAHLQSVPCPWLRACGSVPCYARRFPDGATEQDPLLHRGGGSAFAVSPLRCCASL